MRTFLISRHFEMADASTARLERTIVALEARLATLTDDGVKTIPATSNPGESPCQAVSLR